MNRVKKSLVLFILPIFFSGCSLHRVKEVTLPSDLPDSFSEQGPSESTDRWWESFNDPLLNKLIKQALKENFDLKSAVARLEQAEALARKAGALHYPELSFGGSALRGRSEAPLGTSTGNRFVLGLSAGYELDFWKRVSSNTSAAGLDAVAANESMQASALSLSSQVADSWYSILELRTRIKLLKEQQAVSKTFLDLVELRFGQGQSSAVEVYQQREQLASTETLLPLAESNLEIEEHRLAVLMGKAPKANVVPERSETPRLSNTGSEVTSHVAKLVEALLPPLPATGVPAETLLKRPDVRGAMARVKAADYRIASAIANRFPAFRLGGSSNYQDSNASELFNNWLWSIVGNLAAPIVDGGRRRAEVDRSKAVLKEALNTYQAIVLRSLQEIEDALSRERFQRQFLDRLGKQLEFAKLAYREARQRYVMGLSPYLSVLTELRARQNIERIFLGAQKDLISIRIALLKALGASWPSEIRKTNQEKAE